MAVQEQEVPKMDYPPTESPPLEPLRPERLAGPTEPRWLWDSVRYRFWDPTDLAGGIRRAGPFTVEQREAIASWWSLLAAVEGLGPRVYAAAFVRATEQHDSDQVRWSLLAMLRDEVQHEQLFRLGMQYLAPGGPRRAGPWMAPGQAERYWHSYQHALNRHGIAVVTGGLLLTALVTGDLYDRCA